MILLMNKYIGGGIKILDLVTRPNIDRIQNLYAICIHIITI